MKTRMLVNPRVYDDLPAGSALELRALEMKICSLLTSLDEAMPTWQEDPLFASERAALDWLHVAFNRLCACIEREASGRVVARIALAHH